jgi:hypothetical protein
MPAKYRLCVQHDKKPLEEAKKGMTVPVPLFLDSPAFAPSSGICF